VGYEEGGQLTEAVRRRPYAVVLFDEIEKAHPEVFNVLLQLLDDGRLTDNQGRTVDFKNTVVIMTSNIGSPALQEGIGRDGEIAPAARDAVMVALRRHFRPEFLNRIDDIVLFKPLRIEEVREIARLMLGRLTRRLAEQRIDLAVSDATVAWVAESGFDPVYGARPLLRFIQRHIEGRVGRAIVSANVGEGGKLAVDVQNGELVVEVASGRS
jgi:ATP-dependent Clp protease ATP-binding subunit ClpB